MPQDYFITDVATLSPRWQDAFDRSRICASLNALPANGKQTIRVWLLTGCMSDWPDHMAALAERDFLVIAMTRAADANELKLCLQAGARGYIDAYANTQTLQQVAQSVAGGAIWLPASVVAGMLGAIDRQLPNPAQTIDQGLTDRLTSRELDVVEQLRQGMTNKQIARALGISERTVKEHLGSVFRKFGVSDRLQLVLRLNGRNTAAAGTDA